MSVCGIEVDTRIEAEGWARLGFDCAETSRRAIQAAARRVNLNSEAALDLLLTSDTEMRRLNAQWRGLDKPTDVLSFPAGEGPAVGEVRFLGDIAMGLDTCVRDAERLQRDLARHVSHLAVHGFLHLLGYDHVDSADAAMMEALEVQILGDLGYPDPYDLPGPAPNEAIAP